MRQAFEELTEELEGKAEKALDVLETGLEDAIAVLALPATYRRRLRTTNMVERLNEEIRRRERVIRIFSSIASEEAFCKEALCASTLSHSSTTTIRVGSSTP